MDRIDQHLFDTWNRISKCCRRDRVEARRRADRRFNRTFNRPPRAWCLCIRASDTRINADNTIVELDPDTPIDIDAGYQGAINQGIPHTLTIDGTTIRQLTRPVTIKWPGVEWTEAARQLGRHCESIRHWISKGPLRVSARPPAAARGKRGKRIPIVWSPSPLDPNAHRGQPPDPIWGTIWQHLWERLPDTYTLTVRREPRFRAYNTQQWDEGECHDIRQRGWLFVCPGRYFNPSHVATIPPAARAANAREVELNGETFIHVPCGRSVRTLYGPQSVWTIARYLADDASESRETLMVHLT